MNIASTGYANATNVDVDSIPVIDVAPLSDGTLQSLKIVGTQMRDAVERIGFFYVKNHGIDDGLIAKVQAVSREFFAQPLEKKLEVEPEGMHRGYLKVGQAKMYERAKVDLKESFIWGLDVPADDPDFLAGNRMIGPNRWPAFIPEMRSTLNDYLDASHKCAKLLLRALAVAMNAPEDTFVSHFKKPISRGSLVYYPPQPPDAGDQQFGVAPHTDYGVITLLHQDMVGGLQVVNKNGDWVTAHPVPGTLVINSGDLLGRWSNDQFRSTAHRVVNSSGRERFSIAVFVDPDFDTPIVPVTAPGETAKYPQVSCGEYIVGRFDAAFAYRQKKSLRHLWPNTLFSSLQRHQKMGNKIVTEADRKRTPAPTPLPGTTLLSHGRGQKVSLERGTATRSKKNPGKRSKKGG